MRSVTIYSDPTAYAGWPANHGHWQRGDELLVGFMRGAWKEGGTYGYHNICEPFEKVLARSLDGGESWTVEEPNVAFEALASVSPPSFSLRDSIIRVCGQYDHGGELCGDAGGFYVSDDFGRSWGGPFSFAGLESVFIAGQHANTSRTAVLGSLVFLSFNTNGFDDVTFCAKHDGSRFEFLSRLTTDSPRAVMPAVVKRGGRVFVALRRRSHRKCWIDVVSSSDMTEWTQPAHVTGTGGHNGNPPALAVSVDGRLIVAYGHRGHCTIEARFSDDGVGWSDPLVLRHGVEQDIGYPRLFTRSDGALVCVYYWSDAGEPQRIEATVFHA